MFKNVLLIFVCAFILAVSLVYGFTYYSNNVDFIKRPESQWATHPTIIFELCHLIEKNGGTYHKDDLIPVNMVEDTYNKVSVYKTIGGVDEFQSIEKDYIKQATADRLLTWEECQNINIILDDVAMRIMLRDLNKDHNEKVDKIINLFE